MFNFSLVFQLVQLVIGIVNEVHAVQGALPGAPGAEKSQAVIYKVTPIASVLGAHADNIQTIINGVVAIAKAAGSLKVGEAAASASEQTAA
jgi:hypothetical protein